MVVIHCFDPCKILIAGIATPTPYQTPVNRSHHVTIIRRCFELGYILLQIVRTIKKSLHTFKCRQTSGYIIIDNGPLFLILSAFEAIFKSAHNHIDIFLCFLQTYLLIKISANQQIREWIENKIMCGILIQIDGLPEQVKYFVLVRQVFILEVQIKGFSTQYISTGTITFFHLIIQHEDSIHIFLL